MHPHRQPVPSTPPLPTCLPRRKAGTSSFRSSASSSAASAAMQVSVAMIPASRRCIERGRRGGELLLVSAPTRSQPAAAPIKREGAAGRVLRGQLPWPVAHALNWRLQRLPALLTCDTPEEALQLLAAQLQGGVHGACRVGAAAAGGAPRHVHHLFIDGRPGGLVGGEKGVLLKLSPGLQGAATRKVLGRRLRQHHHLRGGRGRCGRAGAGAGGERRLGAAPLARQ